MLLKVPTEREKNLARTYGEGANNPQNLRQKNIKLIIPGLTQKAIHCVSINQSNTNASAVDGQVALIEK